MHHCPVVKPWDRPARLAATEPKKPRQYSARATAPALVALAALTRQVLTGARGCSRATQGVRTGALTVVLGVCSREGCRPGGCVGNDCRRLPRRGRGAHAGVPGEQAAMEPLVRPPTPTHRHTHARTHACTPRHARPLSHMHTRTHAHARTRTHAHTHTYTHTSTHKHTHTRAHTHTHTHTQRHTHTLKHTHRHTHTHTHTHTDTHTHVRTHRCNAVRRIWCCGDGTMYKLLTAGMVRVLQMPITVLLMRIMVLLMPITVMLVRIMVLLLPFRVLRMPITVMLVRITAPGTRCSPPA